MMKIFLDTEFIEDGKTIDLMSIGLIDEYGKSYYAESQECKLTKASPWVKKNVIPNLIGNLKSRKEIKKDIIKFVGNERPEFWANYAAYDWIAVCQLFGIMCDLPPYFPMYCNDFQQLLNIFHINDSELGIESNQSHNALGDAIELREKFLKFRGILNNRLTTTGMLVF